MNRFCYPMTNVEEYHIGTITVPNGGLKAGDVVIANTLDSSIKNNFSQYEADLPSTASIRNEVLAIVLDGGNYEKTNDGRLPKGNPNYGEYVYRAGETAPILFLEPDLVFYLSDDCLAEAGVVGKFLYGQDGFNTLAMGNSVPNSVLTSVKIMKKLPFRIGGQFGSEFATGNVCKVLPYTNVPMQYTVTFNTDGGSSVDSQIVDKGEKATKPSPDPTKIGYTFVNWYQEAAFTNVFNFNSAINADTTIYAKFTINEYTVTFNSNGGSEVAAQTVEYDSKATKPADPTKDGYTFDNWYSDEELTTVFDFDTKITANKTLYAKWTEV